MFVLVLPIAAAVVQKLNRMSVLILPLLLTLAVACRDRGEPIPPDLSLDVARQIKERYCYIAGDIAKVWLVTAQTTLLKRFADE